MKSRPSFIKTKSRKRNTVLNNKRDSRHVSQSLKVLLRRRSLAVAVVLIMFSIVGVFLYINSDVFFLRNVEVTGKFGVFVHREDIDKLIGQRLAEPTLFINVKKLRAEIEHSFDGIQSVSITKIFPDKLVINIQEKDADIALVDGKNMLVFGKDGKLITNMRSSTNIDVPVVSVVRSVDDSGAVSSNIEDFVPYAPILLDIIKLDWDLAGLSMKKISVDDSGVYVDAIYTLSKTNGDIRIILSTRVDIKRQYDILRVLLADSDIALNNVKEIDLRYKRPVLRYKE